MLTYLGEQCGSKGEVCLFIIQLRLSSFPCFEMPTRDQVITPHRQQPPRTPG